MAFRDLFFSIMAKDKTGAAFASVTKRAKELDATAVKLSDRFNRVGKSMRNIGGSASVASAGVAAMFRGSIGLYDTQMRAEAKVAQAIKATGGAAGFTADQLKAEASALQGLTRFGDEDILNNVTAQLLTFKEIGGDTFKDAQVAALDLSTVLDGDLKSASIMLGKALNDPATGLSAMSRAGVTFTETQKAMVKQMVEAGNVAGAQRLILDEIASAYGGQAQAARMAGAGVLDAWNNTWGDIKEVVGGVLLDGLRAMVPPLETIAKKFQEASPGVQRFIVVAGALAVILPPIVAALGLFVMGAAALSAPVIAGAAAVAAITAAVVAFWPQLEALVGWLAKTWDGMSLLEKAFAAPVLAVRGLWELFKAAFPDMAGIVSGMVDKVVSIVQGKFMSVMDAIGTKVEWVNEKFAWLYDRVVGNSWVPDLVDEIGVHFNRLTGEMVKPTDDATGAVDTAFSSLGDRVVADLQFMRQNGELTFAGFMDSLSSQADAMVDEVVGQAFNRLSTGAMDALSGAMSGMVSGFGGGASSGGGGAGIMSGLADFGKGLLGLDTGGAFTVRGRGGVDRNVAMLRLSEGEDVEVKRAGQSSGGGVNVTFNISTPDVAGFRRSRAQIATEMQGLLGAATRAA